MIAALRIFLGFVLLFSRNNFPTIYSTFYNVIKWTICLTDCLPKNNKRNGFGADEDEKDFSVDHLCRENDAETDMPKGNNFSHLWQ